MKKNVFFMLFVILILGVSYGIYEIFVPARGGNANVEVEVPKGASFRQVIDILAKERLIGDGTIFLVIGKLTNSDRKIRAGYYSIWTSMTPWEILKILRQGRVVEYQVRVLEGDSLTDIADTFASSGLADKDAFRALAGDQDFLDRYNIDAPSIEGYLFPDTYTFPKGMSLEEAVGLMIDRMREKFSGDLMKDAAQAGMTEREALTLASIIEKESVIDSERPLISAVYHNRLKKHMPLQADPTSIYGYKTSHERITLKDLRRKSLYNTYVISGLPPGPIASPGLKSIEAAVHPASVPYLYFVAHDDKTHIFSTTISEHMKAVQLYRARRSEMRHEGNGDTLRAAS